MNSPILLSTSFRDKGLLGNQANLAYSARAFQFSTVNETIKNYFQTWMGVSTIPEYYITIKLLNTKLIITIHSNNSLFLTKISMESTDLCSHVNEVLLTKKLINNHQQLLINTKQA